MAVFCHSHYRYFWPKCYGNPEPVALADLEAAREAIITAMITDMPDKHRRFLLGFKRGHPEWELLGIPEAQRLPAVLWKKRNLDQLTVDKRHELTEALGRVLLR
ncbi:MAG: hypothetical protein KA292_13215 [Sphingorhabdus sp.]|nr:hypothetical protein [Sphingorhabdus sp.]